MDDLDDQRTAMDAVFEAGRMSAERPILFQGNKRMYPAVMTRCADGSEDVFPLSELFERDTPLEKQSGTATFHDLQSFLRYYDEHAYRHSRLYAELKSEGTGAVKFTGVIDEHCAKGESSWREHRVVYTPKHSREWNTWIERNKKQFEGNEVFAEWLIDQLPDVISPPSQDLMDVATKFHATEGRVYGNAVDLDNGRRALQFTNNVEGHATNAAGGRIEIPNRIRIKIPVWDGLEAELYEIDAHFRYRMKAHGAGVQIWYDLVRPHKIVQKAFETMVAEIREGRELYFGDPNR